MTDILDRIQSRIHDAPMPTERLLDDAGWEIRRLREALRLARGDLLALLGEIDSELAYSPAHQAGPEKTGAGQS